MPKQSFSRTKEATVGRGKPSDQLVLSTHAFEEPLPDRQETEIELWGVFEGQGTLDELPGKDRDVSDDDDELEDESPEIFEGRQIGYGMGNLCIVSVSVGGSHAVFVSSLGEAWSYGKNDRGQLGVGAVHEEMANPVPIREFFTHYAEELTAAPHSQRTTGHVMPAVPAASSPSSATPQVAAQPTSEAVGATSTATSGGAGVSDSPPVFNFVTAVACGTFHTLLLLASGGPAVGTSPTGSQGRSPRPGPGGQSGQRLYACGAGECLGLKLQEDQDQNVPQMNPYLKGATAIAAWADASCCTVPLGSAGSLGDEQQLLYMWGTIRCCLRSDSFVLPTAVFRIRHPVKTLGLGGFFGMALTVNGEVYAWGDGTYGELGGVDSTLQFNASSYLSAPSLTVSTSGSFGTARRDFGSTDSLDDVEPSRALLELPEPGRVLLPLDIADDTQERPSDPTRATDSKLASMPRTSMTATASDMGFSASPSERRHVRITEIACGERHSLLLDEDGHLFAFGDNVAGQCGVSEVTGAGHLTGSSVQRPRLVPIERSRKSAGRSEPAKLHELGAKIFAGRRHSAMVTKDHRLYVWGHPANRKLGHAGFNPDGTEAGEDPRKKRPPGVAVRSPLRDAVRHPRLVYSLLHRRVQTLGLGDECTVIVSGNGGGTDSAVVMSEGLQATSTDTTTGRHRDEDAGESGAGSEAVSVVVEEAGEQTSRDAARQFL